MSKEQHPKQFKHKYLIMLFYEIVGWCYANKSIPRRMDIWVKDEPNPVFTCNLLYYPDKNADNLIDVTMYEGKRVEPQEIEIDNNKGCNCHEAPRLAEHIVSDEMDELTECERSYKNHLKYTHDN